MIAALVLAAGGSLRLGRPKQLLRFGGRSLLRRAVAAALDGGCHPVLVVLGAGAARLREELSGLPVEIVVNARWTEGMATSIRAGMSALEAGPVRPVEAVVLLGCDQPALSADVIRRLREMYIAGGAGSGPDRVACRYAGTLGSPALFARAWFPRLVGLEGDRGAKALLGEFPERVGVVAWPEGARDVDLPGDRGEPDAGSAGEL